MNFNTKQGERVRYANLTFGTAGDIKKAKELLEPGKIYIVKQVKVYDWSSEVYLEGFHEPFNLILFENVDDDAVDEPMEYPEIPRRKLPEKLKATIIDHDNAFLVRIRTDPETTRTGILNVIPTGIEREDRDYAIDIGNRIVEIWNNSLTTQRDALLAACEAMMKENNGCCPPDIDSEVWDIMQALATRKEEKAKLIHLCGRCADCTHWDPRLRDCVSTVDCPELKKWQLSP